jgi:hypothetical protein
LTSSASPCCLFDSGRSGTRLDKLFEPGGHRSPKHEQMRATDILSSDFHILAYLAQSAHGNMRLSRTPRVRLKKLEYAPATHERELNSDVMSLRPLYLTDLQLVCICRGYRQRSLSRIFLLTLESRETILMTSNLARCHKLELLHRISAGRGMCTVCLSKHANYFDCVSGTDTIGSRNE